MQYPQLSSGALYLAWRVVCSPGLPPRFGLHAIRQSVGPVEVGNTAHEAPESIRPAGVSQEGTKYRPAIELPTRADLGRDRELAQPAVVLTRAVRVVEPSFERQGDVLGEKDLWPGAKRYPLVPIALRVPVFVIWTGSV